MFTTIHKHYKVEEWVNFSKKVLELFLQPRIIHSISYIILLIWYHLHTTVMFLKRYFNFQLQNKDALGFVAVSSGSAKGDFDKLKKIIEAVPDLRFICLDVANGYSEHFVEYVRSVREAFPQHVIMVRL